MHPPAFTQTGYTADIQEIHPIGQSVLQVSARDADEKAPNDQITFELDHSFFEIDEQGVIFLKKSLIGDGAYEYRVSTVYIPVLCFQTWFI